MTSEVSDWTQIVDDAFDILDRDGKGFLRPIDLTIRARELDNDDIDIYKAMEMLQFVMETSGSDKVSRASLLAVVPAK